MLIISSREFRAKQKSYFDKVDAGQEILIQRGKNKSYKIVPVTDEDALMSEEEFLKKLDHSIQQIKEGKYIAKQDNETMENFVERLLCTK